MWFEGKLTITTTLNQFSYDVGVSNLKIIDTMILDVLDCVFDDNFISFEFIFKNTHFSTPTI